MGAAQAAPQEVFVRLWIMSDLHLEHSPLGKLVVPEADVCVVAGDVLTKGIVPSLEWLDAQVAPYMPVVFCAGNHEYYYAFLRDGIAAARLYSGSGRVHFFEDSSVKLGDVTFAGATLWSDFDLLGEEWSEIAQRRAAAELNDYRVVKYSKRPFKPLYPVHTFQKHVVSRRYFEDRVNERDGGKLVFLTHHAPSVRSVEERFRKDILSAAFASDMECLMQDARGPDLWIHGHTHERSDYLIGKTRVLANPRGYPGEASHRDFDTKFVVDV
jgi:Icc-related predicted phosphoesterase